jgi:CubicO group peptidase (beta-lactamase class C family)
VVLAACLVLSVGLVVPSNVASAGPGPVPIGEWAVDDPASHGMDPVLLDQARAYAFTPGRNTQGVVVVHGGAIVGEWYAPGAGPDSWAASWSMAKSVTSALIGIALAEGAIPSVDVPMTTYFPEWAGTPREAITLRHVLHMESGLDWLEDYDPTSLASSQIVQMVATQPDQLAYAAGRPARVPPGTAFNYSSGDTMLLSAVLAQATGMAPDDYARQKLFGPLGIDQIDWWRDAAGHTLTYCCVDTTSRDFARFGLLYLRGGAWGPTQVVPAAWVDASLTDTAATYERYGYQWWLRPSGSGTVPPYFAALGHDGQFTYVIPSLDLVVVRNGTYAKSPCPPIADPNLVYYYPPSGLVPGQGTTPPDSWDDEAFLGPIVASLTGSQDAARAERAGLAGSPVPVERAATAAAAACPGSTSSTTGPTSPPLAVAPAGGIVAMTPRFTG